VRLPPVYQTSTFIQTSPGQPLNPDYEYSRAANPTRSALETLASIENGTRGLAFSSGLAATDCVCVLLKQVTKSFMDDLYGGTYRMFTRIYKDSE
jgi:cystathionine beta-lyase